MTDKTPRSEKPGSKKNPSEVKPEITPRGVEGSASEKPKPKKKSRAQVLKEREAAHKAGRRLTAAEWERAKSMWASGENTLVDISEEVGVSVNALHQRFKRHGVTKGQNAAQQEEQIRKEVARRQAKVITELTETALENKSHVVKTSSLLARRIATEIAIRLQNKEPVMGALGNIKTLREAILGLRDSSQTIDSALGMLKAAVPEEDKLPELVIREMTREEVEQMRREQAEEELALFGIDGDIDDDIEIEGEDDQELSADDIDADTEGDQ